jgi:hypothetical protein
MKILVPVKRVVDPNVKIRLKSDGSGIELANVTRFAAKEIFPVAADVHGDQLLIPGGASPRRPEEAQTATLRPDRRERLWHIRLRTAHSVPASPAPLGAPPGK